MVVLAYLLSSLSSLAGQNELKLITLKHRFAEELLPMVQPLVGPQGTANATSNILIVRATPERLVEVEQVVSQLDVAKRNIRIEVSHGSKLQEKNRSLSASAQGKVGDTDVSFGSPDRQNRAQVRIDQGSTRSSKRLNQYLTVMDGASAFIQVGESIPYTQQWTVLAQRYASVRQTTQFYDITTGFAVVPRYIGDEVELTITPRIAQANARGSVDFETLSTQVRVKPGEWFDLGGGMRSRDEVSSTILSSGVDGSSESSSLMIKVD